MFIKIRTSGNLVKDPETKQTKNGEKFVSFTVGSQSICKKPQYFICEVHKSYMHDMALGLTKGSRVYVEGEYDMTQYDTTDGKRLQYNNIYVDELYPIKKWWNSENNAESEQDNSEKTKNTRPFQKTYTKAETPSKEKFESAKPTPDEDLPF